MRSTVLSLKGKTRLRELAPAARGSQDAGSRNLVFTFQLSTVIDVACVCGQSRTIWGRGWATGREGAARAASVMQQRRRTAVTDLRFILPNFLLSLRIT